MKKLNLFLLLMACVVTLSFAQKYPTGLIPPSKEELNSAVSKVTSFYGLGASVYEETLEKVGDSHAKHFDLRDLGLVSPVKFQQFNCGSCWAFAAASSYESSYKMRNNVEIDVSEQDIVNCSDGGNCVGGWYFLVFDKMIMDDYKLTDERTVPYTDQDNACSTDANARKYAAVGYNILPQPDVQTIKDALVKHGVLCSAMYTTPEFQLYDGKSVWDGHGAFALRPNHAVNIVGWDDNKEAWLIKNSWSTEWGDKGYGWVKYNTCFIGQLVSYVDAAIDKDVAPPEPADDKGYFTLGLTNKLDEKQVYEEVYLKIDGKPFRYSIRDNENIHIMRFKLKPGKHKLTILVKSLIKTPKGKRLIFGINKGHIDIDGNANYQVRFKNEKIKNNIYKVKLKEVKW